MKETKKDVTGHGPRSVDAMDLLNIKDPKPQKVTLKDLVKKQDKAGIIDFILKGLESKYKPERGSYVINFETPEMAANFKIVIDGSQLHFYVPNSKGSQKESYTRNLLLKSKAFLYNLSQFITYYTRYRNRKWVISYELPTRTRAKESIEEKAAEFEF